MNSETDFTSLKLKISEIDRQKSVYIGKVIKLEREHKILTKKLKEMCVDVFGRHNMVRDLDEYDFHTHYICTRCSEFR